MQKGSATTLAGDLVISLGCGVPTRVLASCFVLGLHGKALVAGSYRGGLSEQSPQSPTSEQGQPQKGPAAGQSRARERCFY